MTCRENSAAAGRAVRPHKKAIGKRFEMAMINSPEGSLWRRWDLHLHTPITRLANSYEGAGTDEAWNRFIDALEDSEVVLITKPGFEMICARIPAFNDLINSILNKSFIASQNRIHSAISFTAEQKYKSFLEKYPDLTYRVPQHMIASFLGITPETLSRVRKEIAKK